MSAVLLVQAQNELLDYTGHVKAGITPSRRRALVATIQAERAALGWRPLDMSGR